MLTLQRLPSVPALGRPLSSLQFLIEHFQGLFQLDSSVVWPGSVSDFAPVRVLRKQKKGFLVLIRFFCSVLWHKFEPLALTHPQPPFWEVAEEEGFGFRSISGVSIIGVV